MPRIPLLCVLLALPAAAQEPDLAAGKEIFELTCSACHGADGKSYVGVGGEKDAPDPRRDLTSPRVQNRSDASLIEQLTKGIGKLPGYRAEHSVSTAAVAGVVAYLRLLASPHPPKPVPLPAESRGERVYLTHCAPCHGRQGAGIFSVKQRLPPPSGTSVVDLREDPHDEVWTVVDPGPITVIEITEEEMKSPKGRAFADYLRGLERQRHGFSKKEKVDDEDIAALSEYLRDLSRRGEEEVKKKGVDSR